VVFRQLEQHEHEVELDGRGGPQPAQLVRVGHQHRAPEQHRDTAGHQRQDPPAQSHPGLQHHGLLPGHQKRVEWLPGPHLEEEQEGPAQHPGVRHRGAEPVGAGLRQPQHGLAHAEHGVERPGYPDPGHDLPLFQRGRLGHQRRRTENYGSSQQHQRTQVHHVIRGIRPIREQNQKVDAIQ